MPKDHTACVSLPAYVKMGGTKLSLVQPGNYSVRVRATSLAGNGSFTETTYFFMPNRKATCHIVRKAEGRHSLVSAVN